MVTAPTAYAALVTRAGVKKNDWVLVHAAAYANPSDRSPRRVHIYIEISLNTCSGGVGLAAVQVAKALGATGN